ncbi:MAG TPA: AAA family ATPase, partial [Chitinophagales bacterium]|nr:AAA family ATPase [Chitinophagales bacterium]
MEKLRIKNLGAIIDIDIQLSQLTIFIGKQGTGKSTLAKIISIFRNKSFWNDLFQQDDSTETFLVYTEKYGIRTYFNHNTQVQYSYNQLV